MSTDLATRPQFDLSPQTFEQALTFANYLAESDMVPKDFRGKPGNCLIAMQWGMEVGLKALQALQGIAVINGRPSIWGDALLAIVMASPVCKDVIERFEGNGDTLTAVCIAQRHGREDKVARFSLADAKAAGLLGKAGPWTQYRDRMLKVRARAFALRDQFADVLKGMAVAEELMDTPTGPRDMGMAEEVKPEVPACWPADLFEARLPEWRKAIEGKKATADAIIAKAETKHPLTDEQKAAIREKQSIEDAKIVVTFAQVADKLNAAKNAEQLADAGSLIGEVSDVEQRGELIAIFDRRNADFA